MSRANVETSQAAPLFAALGDETRLALIDHQGAGGPQSITRLTAGALITRQAITKHLQVLAAAGMVHDVRHDRERLWSLEVDRLHDARRYLDQIAHQWDEAVERLRVFVED